MRECIKLHEMVCLALRYLAMGETFRLLELQFYIGKKTISRIVIDVCRAIFVILGPYYVINMPRNTRKWLEIAEKFYQQSEFSNGIGAIDGKHIVIEQPFNLSSHYRNYKGTNSEFLYVDVVVNDRNSD